VRTEQPRLLASSLPRKRVGSSLDDRRSAHVPHVVGGVERCGAVHGAAVVPDHEVADLLFMAVDELRLRREFDQLGEQRLPLLDRYADDVRCVRGDIERVPPRTGMSAQRVVSRRRV
jgi:hypothetical protein